MTKHSRERIQRVVFINFGGIGDEILFAPVIEHVKTAFPQAHTTLFLEDRSQAVVPLLEGLDVAKTFNVQGQSRWLLFLQLWQALRQSKADMVISSGSSPFIPMLLWLSGVPIRVGFQTGAISRQFLTVEAPLAPKNNRKGYAATMYFALAHSVLNWFNNKAGEPTQTILPKLKAIPNSERAWARNLLSNTSGAQPRKILIHPGVSLVSIQKNILKGWRAPNWANLIQSLCQAGYAVFLAGGPDDAETIAEIQAALPETLVGFQNLFGKTKNLAQLGALIAESDVLVCVDSSPMHMAVGYGKPLVALFGPTDDAKLVPANDSRFQVVSVQNLTCRPCLWDVRAESCNQPVCLDIPVAVVQEAISQVLQREESTV